MATDGKMVVNKGDQIAIRAMGRTVRGEVLSANWWGENSGWYIEVSTVSNDYSYWKQGYDGGKIVELNGKPVK